MSSRTARKIGGVFGHRPRNIEVRAATIVDAGGVMAKWVESARFGEPHKPVRTERRRFDDFGDRRETPYAFGARSFLCRPRLRRAAAGDVASSATELPRKPKVGQ